MSIDGVRFRRPVVPGDRLELHVEKIQSRANVWKFSGKAIVEGKVAAEATFAAMITVEEGTMPDTAANDRMLHTMIRVHDLDKSLAFYTGPMGMKLLRKRDVPEGKYTLAFVGYGDEKEHCVVELTYNYGHEALRARHRASAISRSACPTSTGMCAEVTKAGGKVTRAPGPVKFGTTVIAFVEDPDGYKIELIERK